ncbi:MAG: DUF1549 domain-containing protein, partial [Verrucomicrobiota bacterium]
MKRSKSPRASFPAILLAVGIPIVVTSTEIDPDHLEFFEKKVRPLLDQHCYSCHSRDGDKIKGGLLLDTRLGSRTGGDSGPAVVPHDLNDSLLYVAVTYEDSSLEMPPKYRLEESEIAVLKEWIEMGAPDPREPSHEGNSKELYTSSIDIETGREHWAYQVPTKPTPSIPSEDGRWSNSTIDRFVEAKHIENNLSPSPDSDPRSLLRRLSFDLTGLPPKSSQVEEFVSSHALDPEAAIAEAADHFLSSDQFGERWGRHWLDVA